jgi:hypothetical protein
MYVVSYGFIMILGLNGWVSTYIRGHFLFVNAFPGWATQK